MDILTPENKYAILKDRLQKLEQNGKNVKSNGVCKKLCRQLRKLAEGIEAYAESLPYQAGSTWQREISAYFYIRR